MRRLVAVTNNLGDKVEYDLDAMGNRTAQHLKDASNNLTQQISPDSGTSTFEHDAAGNITKKTDARGVVTTYTYHALNRITARRYPAKPALDVTYAYDMTAEANQLASIYTTTNLEESMKNHVRLIVTSKELSPSEIKLITGALGGRCWAAGDKRNKSNIIERDNGVVINSEINGAMDINLHIEDIRRLVSGKEPQLRAFSEIPNCEVQLSCVMYTDTAPPLSFEKDVMEWMAAIGASLDIDLYTAL